MSLGSTAATKSTGAALVLAGALGAGFCLGAEDVRIYKAATTPRFGESP